MQKLYIMDHTGHSTFEFDRANKVSLDEAMQRFDELVKERGFTAAVKTGDGRHEVVRNFDPGAEETIMFPRLKGG